MASIFGRLSRREMLAAAGSFATTAFLAESLAESEQQPACPVLQRDEINFDPSGLIVQRDCDGADTAQREGMYWLGQWVRVNVLRIARYGTPPTDVTFGQVMDLLEQGKTGRFRRHPTQTRLIGEGKYRGPINDPITMSRDQVVPLIAAMGVHKDYVRLDRFRNTLHDDHYFINKDAMITYEEFIKRARDVDLLFSGEVDKTILDKAVDFRRDQAAKDKDDVGDDLNLIVQLLLAAVRRGAKVEAIRARYVRERPVNYGVYLSQYRRQFPNEFSADKNTVEAGVKKYGWKPDCTNVAGAMKWYFRAESGGSPGLAELYKPILDRFFWAPVA